MHFLLSFFVCYFRARKQLYFFNVITSGVSAQVLFNSRPAKNYTSVQTFYSSKQVYI